jgi:hypothetical protein
MRKIILLLLILFITSFTFAASWASWPVGVGNFYCSLSGGVSYNGTRVYAPGQEVIVSGAGWAGTCFNNIGRTLAQSTNLEGSFTWLFYYWNVNPSSFPYFVSGSVTRAATLNGNSSGTKYVNCAGSSFASGSHNMTTGSRNLSYYVDRPPRVLFLHAREVNENYFLNFFDSSRKRVECATYALDPDGSDVVRVRFSLFAVTPNGTNISVGSTPFSAYSLNNGISQRATISFDNNLPVGSRVYCKATVQNQFGLSTTLNSYNGVGLTPVNILSFPWDVS